MHRSAQSILPKRCLRYFVHRRSRSVPVRNFRVSSPRAKADFEPSATLHTGQKMPMIGLGTWQSQPNEVEDAVKHAIDFGYRMFDTAYFYGNEGEVGQAVRKKIDEGKIKREDVFITTKLWNIFHHPEQTLKGVRKSLDNLKLDHIDLLLIHGPTSFKYVDDNTIFPLTPEGKIAFEEVDFKYLWKELETAVDQKLVKAIGLSSFNSVQIEYILEHARIKPANLQVECHAYLQQKPLYDFCVRHGISFTAYASLGSPARPALRPGEPVLLDEPMLKNIAERHKKTPAQILNRYLIELGRIIIPKSVNRNRMKENFDIFDFKLTEEDLMKLSALDRNMRYFIYAEVKESVNYPFNELF